MTLSITFTKEEIDKSLIQRAESILGSLSDGMEMTVERNEDGGATIRTSEPF